MSSSFLNKPTFLERGPLRFLIMDCPSSSNLSFYAEILAKKAVVAVVRACEASYSTETFNAAGISVLDLPFADGEPPPPAVVGEWLALVDKILLNKEKTGKEENSDSRPCIAVHCVSGLGRAPVLVAIALIEGGLDPLEAIDFIRKKRRGAINAKQLRFLENYQTRKPKSEACCNIQ